MTRLAAAERQDAIVAAATEVFSARSYAGATTAAIARATGVNEALLFRHFGSKAGLYIACIDAAWQMVRTHCEERFTREPDESLHWAVMGRVFLDLADAEPARSRMWVQALTETTGIDGIDQHLAAVMAEVHAFATATVERSQRAGGVPADRNPRAEAWIAISLGLLGTIGRRLGPIVLDDFEAVLQSHRRWITGDAADA